MKRGLFIYLILFIGILILGAQDSHGQQLTQITQYNFNPMIYNPGYTGFEQGNSVFLSYRRQWASVEGTPTTVFFGGSTNFNSAKHGFGILGLSDTYGVSSRTGLTFSYAYKIIGEGINWSDTWNYNSTSLSVGGSLGLDFYRESYSDAEIINDPTFAENIQFLNPAAGLGVYFTSKGYFAGISSPQLVSTTFNAPEGTTVNRRNHYFIMGGKVFDINPDIKAKASVLYKDVSGGPAQIDFLANMLLMEMLEVGAGYRTNSSINFMAGFYFNKKGWVGYSYDVSVVPEIPSNSHEITLKFNFGRKEDEIPEDEVDTLPKLTYLDSIGIEDSIVDPEVDTMAIADQNLKSGEETSPTVVVAAPVILDNDSSQYEKLGGEEIDMDVQEPNQPPTPMVIPMGGVSTRPPPKTVDGPLTTSDLDYLNQRIYFWFNSHRLIKQSRIVLDSVVEILNRHPEVRLRVVGHTCNIGSERQNDKVSKDRAVAVKKYLVKRGISSNRLFTAGRGYSQPYLPNIDERYRKKNRRVQFEIVRSLPTSDQ